MPVHILALGFLLHAMVATWNGLYGPSLGAERDARGFHERALAISNDLRFDEFSIGYVPYCNALGAFYHFFSDSLLFGSLLSCFAWLISAILLIRSMKILTISRRNTTIAAAIYALLPSSLAFTSVTLREPYQLLFVNLAMYSILKIYKERSGSHWILFMVALIGMGVLHGGMLMSALFLFVSAIVLISVRSSKGIPWVKIIFIAPVVLMLASIGLSLFTNISYNLDDGLGHAVQSYQQGGLDADARAQYKDGVEISGPMGLLLFIPISLFQYLFEPMPWRISNSFDIIALAENALRILLIWLAISGLIKMPAWKKKPVLYLFTAYIAIECIWSLGTINWGTAIRHHLPSLGLLLISAFAYSPSKSVARRYKMRIKSKAATSQELKRVHYQNPKVYRTTP